VQLRNLSRSHLTGIALAGLMLLPLAGATAQEPTAAPGTPPPAPVKPQPDPKTENKTPPKAAVKPDAATAEQVVEAAILVSGGRETFNQIRKFGLERGKRFLVGPDRKTVEATYERRFKRGETSEKDQIRLDQLVPVPYGLVYANNESWGMLNNTRFSPRAEILQNFQEQMWHSLDALFRYKEDGGKLTLVGKEKRGGVDVYIIDLAHKVKVKGEGDAAPTERNLTTRYFISVKLLRVLWLEYDSDVTGTNAKYMRRFYDYKVAQGTFVPYRSVLLRDGEQVEETNILTVTYGVKLDDSLFARS
jgi:hypothetical protein